ncbi:hypothetical protein [Sinomonas mesophila]|nr:hypothetical protein [Sinomonas mesophila]
MSRRLAHQRWVEYREREAAAAAAAADNESQKPTGPLNRSTSD